MMDGCCFFNYLMEDLDFSLRNDDKDDDRNGRRRALRGFTG